MVAVQQNALTLLDECIKSKADNISAYVKHKGDFTRNKKLNAETTIKVVMGMSTKRL